MRKEIQIHRLDTKSVTDVVFNSQIKQFMYGTFPIISTVCNYQHVYVTVAQEVEPIKEGDWITDGRKIYHNKVQLDAYIGLWKIIATTDKKLFIDILPIVYLPQIQQSLIKEYCDKGGKGKWSVEYTVEEEPTNDGNSGKYTECILEVNQDNTITIYPLEERTYSREEILEALSEPYGQGGIERDEYKMRVLIKLDL